VLEHSRGRSQSGLVTVGPDDVRYGDLAGRGSRRFAGKPDYVQLVSSREDVVEAVQDAVRKRLRVAVRSGGHCLEAFVSDPEVRVVIDTSLMSGVYLMQTSAHSRSSRVRD
jgi:FAD/FMN-containing dehydrogenase